MKTDSSLNARDVIITQPVGTLLDEGEYFRILIKLPGIAEEKIRIDLENQLNSITIIASDNDIFYKKEILIPTEVQFRKKHFSGGVLEIFLKKIIPEIL